MTLRQTVPYWAAGPRFCHPGAMTTTAAPVAAPAPVAPPRARTPLSRRAGTKRSDRLRRILPAPGTRNVDVAAFGSSI